MKGISIAIETIIYLILAVVVLSVLLMFFTTLGGQSQHQVQMEYQRNQRCGQYTMYDTKCESVENNFPKNIQGRGKILEELAKACKYLQFDQCNSDTATIECIKNCCLGCPK
jgi:hypothetical protein